MAFDRFALSPSLPPSLPFPLATFSELNPLPSPPSFPFPFPSFLSFPFLVSVPKFSRIS